MAPGSPTKAGMMQQADLEAEAHRVVGELKKSKMGERIS